MLWAAGPRPDMFVLLCCADIRKQLWQAFRTSDGAWVSDLRDGVRYMLGIGFLPTGEHGSIHTVSHSLYRFK